MINIEWSLYYLESSKYLSISSPPSRMNFFPSYKPTPISTLSSFRHIWKFKFYPFFPQKHSFLSSQFSMFSNGKIRFAMTFYYYHYYVKMMIIMIKVYPKRRRKEKNIIVLRRPFIHYTSPRQKNCLFLERSAITNGHFVPLKR